MKKLLAAILLSPLLVIAKDQSEKPPVTSSKSVVCTELPQLLKEIEGVKEMPFWAGSDKNSYYGLFVNQKTREWTLIQFNANVGCILGVGGKHTHIFVPNS